MVVKFLKLWVIGLFFTAYGSQVQSREQEPNDGIGKNANASIRNQVTQYQKNENTSLIEISRNNYSTPNAPRPSSMNSLDQISNYPGFVCGRCHSCAYLEHEHEEEHGKEKRKKYSLYGCTYGEDYLDKNRPSSDCIGCHVCTMGPLFSWVTGWSISGIWLCVDKNACASGCLGPWALPSLVTTGINIVFYGYSLLGWSAYGCAKYYNKRDFTRSFQRGLYCSKNDTFSCTGLGKLCNPCCGESYPDHSQD